MRPPPESTLFPYTTLFRSARQVVARVRYGIAASLALEAGYANRRVDYSTVEYIVRENTQDTANVGLRWSSSDLLSLGVGLRYTKDRKSTRLNSSHVKISYA